MDSNHGHPEGKQGKTKRTRKRNNIDTEKKSAKCDDLKDKLNSGISFPENESGHDFPTESSLNEGGADASSGDSNSSEALSMNLVLGLILNEKKKELLEYPEVIQLLQQTSRNT